MSADAFAGVQSKCNRKRPGRRQPPGAFAESTEDSTWQVLHSSSKRRDLRRVEYGDERDPAQRAEGLGVHVVVRPARHRVDEPPAPEIAGIYARYVSDWRPVDRAEGDGRADRPSWVDEHGINHADGDGGRW